MAHRSAFDFSALDYEALSPAQRAMVVQSVMRDARVVRAEEILALARAGRRAILRIGALGWSAVRSLGRTGATAATAAWRRYRARRQRRIAAAQLYAMDDRALRDIGLRRGEIEFAVNGAIDPTRRPRAACRARDPLETLRPRPERQPPERLGASKGQRSRAPSAALNPSLP